MDPFSFEAKKAIKILRGMPRKPTTGEMVETYEQLLTQIDSGAALSTHQQELQSVLGLDRASARDALRKRCAAFARPAACAA